MIPDTTSTKAEIYVNVPTLQTNLHQLIACHESAATLTSGLELTFQATNKQSFTSAGLRIARIYQTYNLQESKGK